MGQPLLTLLEPTEIAILTFGGKQIYTAQPQDFEGTAILTSNEAFTIMQAGLNWYVFPTAKIKIHGLSTQPRSEAK